MTPDQVEIVQRSFEQIAPVAERASHLFYRKLFEIAPEVRPMFNSNMQAQGKMLMSMLATVVSGLDKPETILPAAESLAIRHKDYGVVPEHYGPVGAALLWTISQALGEGFTRDVRGAWVEAYSLLSGVMINAASNDVVASPVVPSASAAE